MELISYSKNIRQTVALPCYGAKNIGWLSVESFCRENPTPYDWELIVCEEPHDKMLGADFFYKYTNRLVAVGCNRIIYLSPEKWIPLSQKWRMIAQAADPESISFIKADADCYSPQGRLELSHKLVMDGYEWIDYTQGYFYSIPQKKLILYDAKSLSSKRQKKKRNLSMAFPTKLAKKLPFSTQRRIVDKWLFQNINPQKVFRIDDLYPSIDSHGENNISDRDNYFSKPRPPFRRTDKRLEDIGVPKDIVDRLYAMA